MSEPQPSRPWRVIANELSREKDPEKVTELAKELTQALDEQLGTKKKRPNSKH